MRMILRFAAVLLVCAGAGVATAGCGDPSEDARAVAESCGKQECPVGTAYRESRSIVSGVDISGGYDPATYEADGAYKKMGSGDCEFLCQVINACPDGTFPVITADCFTCTAIVNGEPAPTQC